jgi:hypothetical protein
MNKGLECKMDDVLENVSGRTALLADELLEHQRHFDALQSQALVLLLKLEEGHMTSEAYNRQIGVIRAEAIAMAELLGTKMDELKRAQQVVAQVSASLNAK